MQYYLRRFFTCCAFTLVTFDSLPLLRFCLDEDLAPDFDFASDFDCEGDWSGRSGSDDEPFRVRFGGGFFPSALAASSPALVCLLRRLLVRLLLRRVRALLLVLVPASVPLSVALSAPASLLAVLLRLRFALAVEPPSRLGSVVELACCRFEDRRLRVRRLLLVSLASPVPFSVVFSVASRSGDTDCSAAFVRCRLDARLFALDLLRPSPLAPALLCCAFFRVRDFFCVPEDRFWLLPAPLSCAFPAPLPLGPLPLVPLLPVPLLPAPLAGSSGKVTGKDEKRIARGFLDHPAMLVSLYRLGSMVLDIDGNRLDATFLSEAGERLDYFTMIKGSGKNTDRTTGSPAKPAAVSQR